MIKQNRVAIYCRCSTSEKTQDVQLQVDACIRYCEAQGWPFKIFTEYESAYQVKKRPIFEAMMEQIRLKEFDILLVYMLDRFSRQRPTQVVADFNKLIEIYKCRFVSLRESIDSEQPMFEVLLMIMSWMSHNFSRMLGMRVKEGIESKRRRGLYRGGRPKLKIDIDRLREIIRAEGTLPLRKLAQRYNSEVPPKMRVGYTTLRKILPLVQ